MDVKLRLIGGIEVTARDASINPEKVVRKRFNELIRQSMIDRGSDFLTALYDAHEIVVGETLEQLGIIPACSKGCSLCCSQIFTCFPMEMDLIVKHLKSNRFNYRTGKEIKRRMGEMKKMMSGLRNSFHVHQSEERLTEEIDAKKFDTICPFLSADGTCLVYEVRPMLCRTLRTQRRCDIDNNPGRVFLVADGVTEDLLSEYEEERGNGANRFFMIVHLVARDIGRIL